MVNKCVYCTVMSVGLLCIIVYMFVHYGPDAGFCLLSALMFCCGILFHTITRTRENEQQNAKNQLIREQILAAIYGKGSVHLN